MQVLKEEIRNGILNSTRHEIITHGLGNVSLRRIARKIGMSPSNIYNYFKDKDELIDALVQPSIKKIDELLSELSHDMVNFDFKNYDGSKRKFVKFSLEQLSSRLFKLYQEFDQSVFIILSSEKYLSSITEWLSNVIYNNYDDLFEEEEVNDEEKKMLVSLIAPAMIGGFRKTMDNLPYCIENNVDVSKLLNSYLNIFLSWKEDINELYQF